MPTDIHDPSTASHLKLLHYASHSGPTNSSQPSSKDLSTLATCMRSCERTESVMVGE